MTGLQGRSHRTEADARPEHWRARAAQSLEGGVRVAARLPGRWLSSATETCERHWDLVHVHIWI